MKSLVRERNERIRNVSLLYREGKGGELTVESHEKPVLAVSNQKENVAKRCI